MRDMQKVMRREVYRNLHYGKSTMLNLHGSSINAFYAQDLPAVRRGQAEMFRLHADGKLTPHIHSRFPLTEVAQAIAEIENRSVIGKVLLEV